MPRHWFLVFLPFIFFLSSVLTECDSNSCPNGGIWGEWSATGSCATTCGACSTLDYTRKCVSDQMAGGCKCSGNSTTTKRCGTQACNYPRNNASGVTCCEGTTLMLSNNWYHCGPLATNTLTCCPKGGYWSAWTTWQKKPDRVQWTRTRSCLSGGVNCPCEGDSIENDYKCPCKPIEKMSNPPPNCPEFSGLTPWLVRDPFFQAARCVNTFIIEASNFRQKFHFTNTTAWLTKIGWVDMTGKCHIADVGPVGSDSTSGAFFKFNFGCDLPSRHFRGGLRGVDMNDVVMIAQFY